MGWPFSCDSVVISGSVTLTSLTERPDTGAGVSASLGTIGIRYDVGNIGLWQKTGSGDTEWQSYATGSIGSSGLVAHASSHQDGGDDEINVVNLSGLLADPQTPLAHSASHMSGGSDVLDLTGLSGLLATAQTPASHASSHQNDGADEISVAGLSGLLADPQTPLSHSGSHMLGGSDVLDLTGLSGLLATAQTPVSHASSHQNNGADEISVTGLSGLLADPQPPITSSLRSWPSMQYSEPYEIDLTAATCSFSVTASNYLYGTLGSSTILLANPGATASGMWFTLAVQQYVSGSSSINFDTGYDWGDEGAPDTSTLPANKWRVITFNVLPDGSTIMCTTVSGFGSGVA